MIDFELDYFECAHCGHAVHACIISGADGQPKPEGYCPGREQCAKQRQQVIKKR